jgi:zinc protease
MRAFYLERFGDVGDFTFVFVGDVTSAQIERLVQRYLATLPGSGRADGARHPDVPYQSGITRVRVERGTQTQAVVSVRYHGEEPVPSRAEAELNALRVYLALRLREVLREQLGGVYDVDVSYELRQAPRQGYEIGFRFACQPDQAQQLEQAALAVIDGLRTVGTPATYVETVEHQLARSAQFATRSSAFWLDHLLEAYRQGRDPAAAIALATSVEHIDSDTLRRAARRYLRSNQYVEALLLPAPRAQAGVSSAALTR